MSQYTEQCSINIAGNYLGEIRVNKGFKQLPQFLKKCVWGFVDNELHILLKNLSQSQNKQTKLSTYKYKKFTSELSKLVRCRFRKNYHFQVPAMYVFNFLVKDEKTSVSEAYA